MTGVVDLVGVFDEGLFEPDGELLAVGLALGVLSIGALTGASTGGLIGVAGIPKSCSFGQAPRPKTPVEPISPQVLEKVPGGEL